MAEAYATFASGGIHCDPIILDTITDSSGKALRDAERELQAGDLRRRRGRHELVAGQRDDRAAPVPGWPPPTAARRPARPGTIDSNAAVWFVGYTPQVAGAAMISIDNQRRPFVKSADGLPGQRT